VKFTALAIDTTGKPIKGQSVEVRGRSTQVISTRKRMVGGLYAYDNRNDVRDLGVLCSGSTDERGLLLCDAPLSTAGQVELIAQGKDGAGNLAEASTSVWVTRQGELWFAQDNDDRIDVLPEKKFYEPGEIAELQVRMPFREATALVSVEREGVIDHASGEPAWQRPDRWSSRSRNSWGPERLCERSRAARAHPRRAMVFVLSPGAGKSPSPGRGASGTKGASTRRRRQWSILAKPSFKLGVAALKGRHRRAYAAGERDERQAAVRDPPEGRGARQGHAGRQASRRDPKWPSPRSMKACCYCATTPRGTCSMRCFTTAPGAWKRAPRRARSSAAATYGRKAVAAGGGGGRGRCA
jgi:hypothetical protein